MEFKGTNGTWYIDQDESHEMKNGVWCTVISTPQTIGLADVYGDEEEAKANAQLIATAPKLLEALQRVEDYLTALYESNETAPFPLRSELDNVREVINQATKID
jgi:hypothetical protein